MFVYLCACCRFLAFYIPAIHSSPDTYTGIVLHIIGSVLRFTVRESIGGGMGKWGNELMVRNGSSKWQFRIREVHSDVLFSLEVAWPHPFLASKE